MEKKSRKKCSLFGLQPVLLVPAGDIQIAVLPAQTGQLLLGVVAHRHDTVHRVNAKMRDADVAVRYDGTSEPASLTVSSGRGTSSFTVPVEKYTTENGYCYYTYDGN